MIRLQDGRALLSLPLHLPADPAVPFAGVTRPARFEAPLVPDVEVMQTERRDYVPGWLWTPAALLVLACCALFVIAISRGLVRAAGSDPAPSRPASRAEAAAHPGAPMGLTALVSLPVTAPATLLAAAREIPRLTDALTRLAASDGPLARLSTDGGALDRLVDVSETLDRLAGLDETLGRLAELERTLERLGALSASLDGLAESAESLPELAVTVARLDVTIASLDETIAPLQGASERLGRVVDRLPHRRTRGNGNGD